MRCRRCDWQSEAGGDVRPREQLLEHAQTAGHPLCLVCSHSLGVEEQQTCETGRPGRRGQPPIPSCLATARDLLSGIVTMYFEDSPRQLGQLRGVAYDHDRPSAADGRPLPGGDLLVLLGPGSQGLAEDGLSTRDDDPASVAFDLGFWEARWRETRKEARRQSHRPKVVVRQAAAYLEIHARWAAREHPGFADYLDDLRMLHERLERATGRFSRPVRAEAECFGCGADALVRELTERGYADLWTCQRCGETYDWTRYLLALSGRLQESDVPGWGLPEQVGYVLGVNPRTVKSWAERGQVSTACLREGDPRIRVWWDDARERAAELEERRRRQAEREAERQAERASA